jgi:hypothetical protein
MGEKGHLELAVGVLLDKGQILYRLRETPPVFLAIA